MTQPFSHEFIKLIADEYRSGANSTELAAKYGIGKTSVMNAVKRTGETVRSSHKHKHSLDTRLQIANEYRHGMTTLELAHHYGVSRQTIANYLYDLKVEMRTSGGTLTPSQVRDIAQAYDSGRSSTEVAQTHGISVQTVFNAATKHAIVVRDRGDYPVERKHFFNEDFFAKWSPEMAYVLGFVFADGTIQRNLEALRIYQKDREVLDMISVLIGYEGPYDMSGTPRNIHTLRLNSVKLVADLVVLGVLPSKSLIAAVPDVVPFPAQFVRGYFDGDGHGNWYKKRSQRVLRIGFTSGSNVFLQGIKCLLPAHIGGPYKGKGNSWGLQTSSLDAALTIRDWMYADDSGLWIERKHGKLYK